MNMKHTPGPWVVSDTGVVTAKTSTTHIADCYPRNRNFEADAPMANARLIAAAPELLEACKGVDVLYSELHAALPALVGTPAYDIVVEAVKKARAASAKAVGSNAA